MSRQFESVTPLKIGFWDLRVWRTESERGAITDQDLMETARGMTKRIVAAGAEFTRAELLEAFADLPNVSAVEVADTSGAASIEYIDWPT